MAALDNLPLELITEILSHLPAADLAQASLLSRVLYDVSTPVLYKSPVLRNSGPPTNRQCLKMFLNTLLTPGKETLVTHVRSLNWVVLRTPARRCPIKKSRPATAAPTFQIEKSLLAAAAARFGLPRDPETEGAQFVLLIHLIPHLRILQITPPLSYSSFTRFMDRHLTSPVTDTNLPLQSLREFYAPQERTRGGVTYTTLISLLALPSIRLIDVRIADSESRSELTVATPVASSSVTHMRICDRNMTPEYLAAVLTAPIRLTHFSYTTIYYSNDLDYAAFWSYLRPLAASVVNLHLELRLRRLLEGEEPQRVVAAEAMLSMVEWTALKTLSCTSVVVLGREMGWAAGRLALGLPRRLRELEIMSDGNCAYEEVVDEVIHLMVRMNEVVPRLQTIAVQPALGGSYLEVAGRLRCACELAGVVFVEGLSKW